MIYLDVTRILSRFMRSAPTGIDRVEFAYLEEIWKRSGDYAPSFVLTTPWFSGLVRAERVLDIIARLERAWGLHVMAAEDVVYGDVKSWIERPLDQAARRTRRFGGKTTFQMFRDEMIYPFRDIARAAARLTRQLERQSAHAKAYLNVSHLQLDTPERLDWTRRHHLDSAFLLHDTIPIDYPEFCAEGADTQHQLRLKTVGEMGSLVIVNSQFTANSVRRHFENQHLPAPNLKVVPLGVDAKFNPGAINDAPKTATPYFICVGTIEPRKNLQFLLAIWRRLIDRNGANAPRLLIVGRRGWENENIVDLLERSSAIAPYVAEVSDLTDAGLAALMAGACAVLAPSIVEGFGLPSVEALACGTPVIASDIEAHREVTGPLAVYVDAIDGNGWISAIEAYSAKASVPRAKAQSALNGLQPHTWPQHVTTVMDELLATLAASPTQAVSRKRKGGAKAGAKSRNETITQ